MADIPSSLDVHDIKRFHMLADNEAGERMFLAEHTLKLSDPIPDYVAIHEMGEFIVVRLARHYKLVYTDDYMSPHTPLVFQFTPRYSPENTQIDHIGNVVDLVSLEDIPVIIASKQINPDVPLSYTVADISPEYAQALIEHHLAVAPNVPRYTYYQNSAPIEWETE